MLVVSQLLLLAFADLSSSRRAFPVLAGILHESPAATADLAVLSGVLGCRSLRRTVQVRLGDQHPAVARWHAHLRALATAMHEISGLGQRLPATAGLKEIPFQLPHLGGAPQTGFKQFSVVNKFFGQAVKELVKEFLVRPCLFGSFLAVHFHEVIK
jgi:hypothetical protein